MSTSSTSGFTGGSTFTADFQQVITRAVGIASLPMKQLQQEQLKFTDQQTELQSLGGSFQALMLSLIHI